MKHIEAPKISEILKEEFMIPYHLSAYRLAKDIDVPISRIQDLLHDRRKITAETSIKLGKYFGLSEKYFLNLQNDIDIREAKELFASSVNKIIPLVVDSNTNAPCGRLFYNRLNKVLYKFIYYREWKDERKETTSF